MKKMTKLAAALMAAAMCLSLAACGNSQGNGDAPIDYSLGLTTDGKYAGYNVKDYVTLGSYTDLELPASVTDVTEEAIQKQIDTVMADHTYTEKVTDRAVADKDTVNIDYVGYVDGVAFDNGSTEGKGTDVTIGTTQYIDDFLDQLVGHKPGETFDVNVTFPDPYTNNPDLAGKDATFSCTINYITETHTLELTDTFVTENLTKDYGYTSVEDMKAKITEALHTSQINEYVWDTAFAGATFADVPEKLVENEFTLIIKQMKYYALTYSTELSMMLNYYYGVSDEAALRTNYKDYLTQQVQYFMLCQAIAEQEGLIATDEDVKAYFKESMGSEDYSDYVKDYGTGYVFRTVTINKLNNYLMENNPAPTAAE